MKRKFKHGNLAKVKMNAGLQQNAPGTVLALCTYSYQDTTTGFYRVNCIGVRNAVPYNGVQVVTQVQPLKNSMGLLLFADGDSQTPLFLPCGY